MNDVIYRQMTSMEQMKRERERERWEGGQRLSADSMMEQGGERSNVRCILLYILGVIYHLFVFTYHLMMGWDVVVVVVQICIDHCCFNFRPRHVDDVTSLRRLIDISISTVCTDNTSIHYPRNNIFTQYDTSYRHNIVLEVRLISTKNNRPSIINFVFCNPRDNDILRTVSSK